jgi:eukaryotic-like serine/threonine-protein kinase
VYLGCSAGGVKVVVRVVRAERAADPWFRTRFRAEVTAAAKVGGPFVARVLDADLDGDVPWLARARVDGPSLADGVGEHGPLSARPLIRLATRLAEGLAAGVVHRTCTLAVSCWRRTGRG